MKTRLTLATVLLAAGGLLIATPASARDNHLGHERDYRAAHFTPAHGRHHDRRFEHRHDYGRHRGHYRQRALGHRHHRPHARDRHHRPQVIVVPPTRHEHYYYGHRPRHHSGLSTITGGVIGGIVGNSLGRGDPVATGIGIMTGAVIGHRMGH